MASSVVNQCLCLSTGTGTGGGGVYRTDVQDSFCMKALALTLGQSNPIYVCLCLSGNETIEESFFQYCTEIHQE